MTYFTSPRHELEEKGLFFLWKAFQHIPEEADRWVRGFVSSLFRQLAMQMRFRYA
jgi:hypothetical protein